jgi:quinol monooxygenase YgiN
MIASTSTLKIQDGQSSRVRIRVAVMAAKVRPNEPGNLLYQLTKSRSDANTYKFLELYEDQDALTRHNETEYYKDLMSKAGSLLNAPPNLETLDGIG